MHPCGFFNYVHQTCTFINMSGQIKTVLIDLSGTLHIENTVIPGAVEALNRLRTADNFTLKFVTNTSKESQNALHNRLTRLGFNIKREEIYSSLAAARDAIISRKLNPKVLVDDAAYEDFQDLVKDGERNAVVVGLAPEKFHYNELNEAFRLLLNGAALIAIHKGRYYKQCDGLSLGPGAFIEALEYAANVKADVIGKPSSEFFKAALGKAKPHSAVMIGDDVKDDIAGAQSVGIAGILVKTGKYRPGDENTVSPSPRKICDSIVEAVNCILRDEL